MIRHQYTIGRAEDCHVRVQDNEQRISRKHATLKVMKNGKMFITDHSSNGTFVNGVRIVANVDFPVKRGDSISFANNAKLDWNLIPRSKNKLLIYAIIAVLLIAGGIAAFCLWDGRCATQPGQEQELVPADSLEVEQGPDVLL